MKTLLFSSTYIKAILITTISILFSPSFSTAQFFQTTRFGFNTSELRSFPSVLPTTGFSPVKRMGLCLGQGIKYKISQKFALQFEYIYLFKEVGADINYRVQLGDTAAYTHTENFSARLHYLQLPFACQYRYNLKKGIVLFANAGFYGAVKLFENSKKPDLFYMSEVEKYRYKYFRNFDYGSMISLGAAFAFEECKGAFAPEIRLTQSFANSSNYAHTGLTIELSLGFVKTFGE